MVITDPTGQFEVGVALIARLTKDLNALQAQLDAGQTPDPKLLKKLGETADALAALLAAPSAQASATPIAEPDALASIEATTSDIRAMASDRASTDQAAERDRVYHELHEKALGGSNGAPHRPMAPGAKQQ